MDEPDGAPDEPATASTPPETPGALPLSLWLEPPGPEEVRREKSERRTRAVAVLLVVAGMAVLVLGAFSLSRGGERPTLVDVTTTSSTSTTSSTTTTTTPATPTTSPHGETTAAVSPTTKRPTATTVRSPATTVPDTVPAAPETTTSTEPTTAVPQSTTTSSTSPN